MAQGPSLQGQIVINTKSVDRAINSIKKLQVNVGKAFGGGSRQAERFAKALGRQSQTYNKVANDSRKYSSTIAKAANTVANYEAAVRKSNVADSKKASLVKAAAAQLKGFESAVKGGATSGKALNNVTTQLNVSLGQLRRDLASATAAEREKTRTAQQHEKAQIKTDKAVSTASQQYERAKAAIRSSSLAEAEKVELLSKLDASHRKLNNTLTKTGTSVRSASSAQNQYSETLNRVNIATKRTAGGFGSASGATNSYADEMRNLSTSVQFALGPLSGIAARITALTTLFNRNAASVAALIASMTGFTVLLTKSMQAGQEAEKQMFRINAQLDQMGDSAQVTGAELNNMAHEIAAATLLSAKEVRDASGALIEFSGIAREQFGAVIKTAQGMSAVFGGNLRSNIRRLGRAIEDPISGMSRLEQTGVILSESTKDQIETLVAQGRAYEATNRLLKETASLQDAAGQEAAGLAGAYDTLSGNLDRLFEQLSVGSGATKTFATSIQGVAQAVADFADSDKARALGESFRYVGEVAGGAFKFAIENINILAGVLAVVAGSVIPKVVAMVLTLATSFASKLYGAVWGGVAAITQFNASTLRANASMTAFNSTLRANPLIAVVSGVIALTGAIWGYHKAMEAVRNAGQGFNKTMLDQIDAEIVARTDLSKVQAQGFRDRMQNLSEETAKFKKEFDTRTALMEKLETAVEDSLGFEGVEKRFENVNGSAVDLLDTVEGIGKLLRKDLTPEQRKMVQDYRSAKIAAEGTEDALNKVTEATKNLKTEVRNADAEMSKLSDDKRLVKLTESLDKMAEKLLPDESKTKELKTQLQTVQASASALKAMGLETEEVNSAYEKAQRLAEAIKEELQEINEIELSSEFESMVDALADAKNEATLLAAQVGKTDEEKAILEATQEMELLGIAAKQTLRDMEGFERAALADFLPGVDATSSIEELRVAYVRYMATQQQAIMQAEREMDANETLKTFREGQRTELQGVAADYMEVYRAAKLVGDEETAQAAKKQFKEDDDRLQREARDIAKTPFSDLDKIEEDYELRKQLLADKYKGAEDQYAEHLDKMKKQAERKKLFMGFADGFQEAGDIVASAMQVMETAGKENTKTYQDMAIVQATVAGALGIAKIWGADAVNPAIAIAKTALISANVGAQIAAIKSQNYAGGGRVQGPGTSTSDSIPANLSDGEYVIKADAARKIGIRNLEMMNSGNMPSYNQGGNVGMMPVGMPVESGGSTNVTIIDQSTGRKEYTTTEETDASGQRNLKIMVRDAVKESINKGEVDREMSNAYGVRRKGRRV